MPDRLNDAVKLLVESCHPEKIILFGSWAEGRAKHDSDIDLLVVVAEVKDKAAEIVRLNRILSPLRLSVDLLVVDKKTFQYWADTPGNVYYEASAGRTLYEAA